jgi:two-component system, NarL family, response regulator YdfI
VTRVVIVASSPVVRAGLQKLLSGPQMDIVGSIANLDLLPDQLVDGEPEVIVVEASGESHAQLLESISASELTQDFAVIVLSQSTPPHWPAEALKAGVRAVLPAELPRTQLRAAVEAAAAGFVVLPPAELATVLPASVTASEASGDDLIEPLTRREREVLQMLAAGLANKEISSRLSISEHTVKFHVASILGKLGASTRTEAVSIGIRRGLVLL